jgi:HEAT repeats
MKRMLSGYTVGLVIMGICAHVLFGDDTEEPVYKGRPLKVWVTALGEIGPAAHTGAPKLCEILKNKKEHLAVRMQAAFALGKVGPAKAVVPILAEALKDEASWVRQSVASTLGKMGGDAEMAVPALIAALGDPFSLVRSAAAGALGSVAQKAKAAIPTLWEMVKKGDGGDRISAATALWRIARSNDALPVLFDLVNDEDFGLAAAGALGEIAIQEKSLVPRVVPILVQRYSDKELEQVERDDIAQLLKKIDPKAAAKSGIK